ncbi:MAG: ADP-ribosylation factor-like protein [Candidatus Ranarchaeia archaeon]
MILSVIIIDKSRILLEEVFEGVKVYSSLEKKIRKLILSDPIISKGQIEKNLIIWENVQDDIYLILILDSLEIGAETDWHAKIEELSLILSETFLESIIETSWYPLSPAYQKFTASLEETLYQGLEMKISLLGEGGVGKTTILNLIAGNELPQVHVPTIGIEIYKVALKFGSRRFVLWDFSGQNQYRDLWKTQIIASEIVIIVTNSTEENLNSSMEIIKNIKEILPNTLILGVANMQDIPNTLSPIKIGKNLKVPTIGLVAIEKDQRKKIIDFIRSEVKTFKTKKKNKSSEKKE